MTAVLGSRTRLNVELAPFSGPCLVMDGDFLHFYDLESVTVCS